MAGAIAAITGGAKSLYEGLKPLDIPVRQLDADETAAARATGSNRKDSPELREKFDEFVAGTFAKTMLKSLRKTTGKVPYMDGGFAEQVFRERLDDEFSKKLTETRGASLSADLYDGYLRRLPGTARDASATSTSNTATSNAAPSEETEHVLSVVL